MNFKKISFGVFVGLISGSLLGVFLKFIQNITNINVYVLLLNVDFLPLIGKVSWPEWIEFSFHLLISCILGVTFIFLIKKTNCSIKMIWLLSFALTLPTVLLYFPLSYLALKDVPELLNFNAIFIWTLGHLLYAISLPAIYFLGKKRMSSL